MNKLTKTISKHKLSLIISAVVVFHCILLYNPNNHHHKLNLPKHRPHIIAEDTLSISTNKSGEKVSQLFSPYLVHYTENETTDLDSPHYVIYSSQSQPWYVSANSGRVFPNSERVELWNQVKLYEPEGSNNLSTTLQTSAMTVYPELRYAETNSFVTITQPHKVVTAQGMKANMRTGFINLLAQAKGHYKPSKKNPLNSVINSKDQELPLDITADSAQINYQTGVSTYLGHVKVIQGDTQVDGDTVVVYTDAQQSVEKIIAFGRRAIYRTKPKQDKPEVVAKARRIYFFPQKSKVILENRGEVVQKPNTFTGPYIVYNAESGTVVTRPSAGRKTTVIIRPEKDQQDNQPS